MSQELTNVDLLRELEPVAEKLINRHMSMFKEWNPHDYVPWKEGKNYYALGGQDWDPNQAKLSEVARTALVQNLLTEDNLPAYHREIAMNFSMDGPWGYWVNRWTAEEYVSFQELATRVSHRNTGKACNDPVAEQLLARISNDENLHMIFYRDVSAAGLDIAPNMAMQSLYRILKNFKMPGYTVPEFRRKAVVIAMGGVYDPRIHLEDVVMPVLKKWRIFEREDFTGEGARLRDELATLITELEETCVKFEEAKERKLDRDAKLAEKRAAKAALAGASA